LIWLLIQVGGAAWASRELAMMAAAWLDVINGALDAYQKVQTIVEYHQKGRELELRPQTLKEIAKEQKEREEKEVERVATACVEVHFDAEPKTKAEATTVTRFVVKFLLKQIEAGTKVETVSGKIEAVPERDGEETVPLNVDNLLKESAKGWSEIEAKPEVRLELPWPEPGDVPELEVQNGENGISSNDGEQPVLKASKEAAEPTENDTGQEDRS